jgi:CheY-like chemotaxis protein
MPSILIVDDEPDCRSPLARLLQIEGYDIAQASDGFEALQRLEEQKTDLILLDLLMPRLDGVGFLERMRDDARFKEPPVFLVTSSHHPTPLARAKQLGITNYPFKADVPIMRMLEMIKKTLGEPYTPIRRGRRPKNPQAQPPNGEPVAKRPPIYDPFDDEDEPADAEFTRD